MNAIAIDDEPLALHVIETFCNDIAFINLQKTFTKPTEALKYLRRFPADLLFVDIQMPSITGVNLVKEVQQNSLIIFTTAYSEYAAESYELNAIDYLLKPIHQSRFNQAVNKAHDYYNYLHRVSNSIQKEIFIRADFSLIRVPLDEILSIEGLGDYLKVIMKDRKTIVARMTMKEISENLPSADFIRIHRSYILPKKRILSVRHKTVFTDDRDYPIGVTYQEEIYKLFNGI